MDGLPALPSLSPAPTAQAFPPQLPGGAPPPQRPAANPVGRPSNDPAEQERRAVRSQEQQRLAGLTPPRAKDSKLFLFELRDGRPGRRPVAMLLASQIEEAMKNLPAEVPEDERMDEAVTQALPEAIDNCHLRCQWYSKDGRPIPDMATWEMAVGDPAAGTGVEEAIDGGADPYAQPAETETFPTQTIMPQLPPVAPAPPALDLGSIARSFREERNDERQNSAGQFQVIAAMM